MASIREILEYIWDEHNASYITYGCEMFDVEDLEFDEDYYISFKCWNDGSRVGFSSIEEAAEHYGFKG